MKDRDQDDPILWRINEWFPEIQGESYDLLKRLHETLIDFAKTSSIFPPKAIFTADAFYFADAIMAGRVIFENASNLSHIHDLNQGTGFPSLVWAILYPQIRFTFIDIEPRRLSFFYRAIEALNLTNCDFDNTPLDKREDGSLKYVVHKGTVSIPMAMLMARKVIAKEGALFHLKGEEWGIEVAAIPTQLCSLWSPSLLGEYSLPISNSLYGVVRSDKIA